MSTLRQAAQAALDVLLRWLCALVGHGNRHERINDGPWICTRCGGVNHRKPL